MLAALEKGDKIITSGGLICEVIKPEEDFIRVKLNDDVIVHVSREFVARKIEKTETKANGNGKITYRLIIFTLALIFGIIFSDYEIGRASCRERV